MIKFQTSAEINKEQHCSIVFQILDLKFGIGKAIVDCLKESRNHTPLEVSAEKVALFRKPDIWKRLIRNADSEEDVDDDDDAVDNEEFEAP